MTDQFIADNTKLTVIDNIPFKIPFIKHGPMYGKLPIIGNLGGPGGNPYGFLVDLYIKSNTKRTETTKTNIFVS